LQSAIAPEFPRKRSDEERTLKALLPAATGEEPLDYGRREAGICTGSRRCSEREALTAGWGNKVTKGGIVAGRLDLTKGTPRQLRLSHAGTKPHSPSAASSVRPRSPRNMAKHVETC
jgi:hypothetical protein